MAIRVDLPRNYLERALEQAIASLRRQVTGKQLNPLMADICKQDLTLYEHAKATMTEIDEKRK